MHGLCDISAQVSLCNVLINHHLHHLRSSASHPCGGEARFPPLTWWRCTLLRFRPDQKPRQALSLCLHHTATPQGRQTKQTNTGNPGEFSLFFFSLVADGKFSTPHSLPLSPTDLTYEQGGLLIQ